MRRFWITLALTASMQGVQANCIGHPQPQQRFTFDVVPQFPAAKIYAAWAPLLERIGLTVQACFELRIASSIPEFERVLWSGQSQWAYANPYHAVVAHKRHRYQPLVADGKNKLSGILVVTQSSPIQNVSALRGQAVAYPAPNAFAASLLIRAELARQSIDTHAVFVKTHGNVYRSVIARDVAAGGGVNNTLASESKETQGQLRVVYETAQYMPHPLLAHPSVPASWQKRVSEALMALTQDAAGQALLDGVLLDQPQRVRYEQHYKPLEALRLERFMDSGG